MKKYIGDKVISYISDIKKEIGVEKIKEFKEVSSLLL